MKTYTYDAKCCEVEEIAYKIGKTLRRWGRVHVTQTKEKYSSCRVYLSFHVSMHTLVYPGYHYEQFPTWFSVLCNKYIDPILSKIKVYPMILAYQVWLYRKVYYWHTRHLDPKHPSSFLKGTEDYFLTREEIFAHADYPELLK